MFKTLANAWKLSDLREKILYTAFIVLLYRIGVAIPVPFVDPAVLQSYMSGTGGSIFQYLNIISGNAFSQATLFALGINPYITASIVIQLLAVAIPALERLSKEGEEGQKKLNQITRYVTVALGLITSFGYYMMLKTNGVFVDTEINNVFRAVIVISCYCAGSALVMWLAEKINDKGIGNGISMILFANIVSRGPAIASALWNFATGANTSVSHAVGIIICVGGIVLGVGMILFIVFMTNSERRIPVQYAKKTVGRKMYGGQSSNLPIKLNMTGVMPIIFANSIISIPATVAMFLPKAAEGTFRAWFEGLFETTSWFYAVLNFILIIAFAYFYVAISFNPVEVSNNLKNQGGSVPGIRPGRPTAEFIRKITNRITLIGAIMLGIISVLPMVINIITNNVMSGLAFGGSSIIIVVGVVLETAREIEGQMTMRHYKGFLE